MIEKFDSGNDVTIYHGDSLDVMMCMPSNSVDSIVTDPPYGLSFMGKKWDYDVPSVALWAEALRVLKPGGHLLSFAGSRTYHRMAVNIEDAGFEIRDQIMWIYGSGFPKSLDIGKQLDKRKVWSIAVEFSNKLKVIREGLGLTKHQAFNQCKMKAVTFGGNSWFEDGRLPSREDYNLLKTGLNLDNSFDLLFERGEREVTGKSDNTNPDNHLMASNFAEGKTTRSHLDITAPATDLAKQWDGWGTALKPAHEPICVARKPLIGTVAENVLKHGTGGINIDGGRVGTSEKWEGRDMPNAKDGATWGGDLNASSSSSHELGRFPANIIFDAEAGAMLDKQSGEGQSGGGRKEDNGPRSYIKNNQSNSLSGARSGGDGPYYDPERDDYYFITNRHNDSGGASRFFYCAKASKADRDEGLEGMELKVAGGMAGRQDGSMGSITMSKNIHPTVKPTALMQYLVRLVTPPDGTVLDPFMGSGSTGKAAVREGFKFIGIEREAEYIPIAIARINAPAQVELI